MSGCRMDNHLCHEGSVRETERNERGHERIGIPWHMMGMEQEALCEEKKVVVIGRY